jgi:hypothetical protein
METCARISFHSVYKPTLLFQYIIKQDKPDRRTDALSVIDIISQHKK